MEPQFIFKIVVIILLITIIISLAAGMLFLVKDKGQTERTLTSLKFRVALSILLFLLLLVGYKMNWITPHNIYPPQIEKAP